MGAAEKLDFGVALLCAIWTSSTRLDDKEEEGEEEKLLKEVKWISKPKETRLSKKKMYISFKSYFLTNVHFIS